MSSHPQQGDADIGFRNLLAHVVSVSIKPLPYMGAGLAGGMAVEVLGKPEGGGIPELARMAVVLGGIALVVAPLFAMLRDSAEKHRLKEPLKWETRALIWGMGALAGVPLMLVPLFV